MIPERWLGDTSFQRDNVYNLFCEGKIIQHYLNWGVIDNGINLITGEGINSLTTNVVSSLDSKVNIIFVCFREGNWLECCRPEKTEGPGFKEDFK